jgi:hypothetical protein
MGRVSCFPTLVTLLVARIVTAVAISRPPPALRRRLLTTSCTGAASANLPADQCAAWQAFYDGASGSQWAHCSGTRSNPCGCYGTHEGKGSADIPTCNKAGTAVVNM